MKTVIPCCCELNSHEQMVQGQETLMNSHPTCILLNQWLGYPLQEIDRWVCHHNSCQITYHIHRLYINICECKLSLLHFCISCMSQMFGFHKPKMYRSLDGCCICRAKSSSSRFTDSKRYERDFHSCFGWVDHSSIHWLRPWAGPAPLCSSTLGVERSEALRLSDLDNTEIVIVLGFFSVFILMTMLPRYRHALKSL